ncbi:hypothetical protein LUD75_01805 [Epilithonimonas sp. JDS]|uniref:hypothetical protein n=1 Tax=Epilithonimonas sp. JDS TaxID=2902797 RepID=UPI001E521AEA|nr:hypothetical protein [Epilithonimonas sp. JDS]MCD9853422.1 hypothetical protein [Epilithonimonas sp. JDS]
MKNYNESSLYVLLYNPKDSNYIIKEINDEILAVDESYYDKVFEVQIKNGAFRLIRHENPFLNKIIRIFRLESEKMMCIGENFSLLKDKLGHISGTYNGLILPVEKYDISYNFNTKTVEIAKQNVRTNKKETATYPIEIEKYDLQNTNKNDYKVFEVAAKIIKTTAN